MVDIDVIIFGFYVVNDWRMILVKDEIIEVYI